MDRIYTNSAKEADSLRKNGYAVVGVAFFLAGNGFTYVLEKGSDWSRMLGSL